MGYLYFDDSKHPQHGFALGVFVFSDKDRTELINNQLRRSGLKPGEDEFKSSALISRNPHLLRLRAGLRKVLCRYCELGVVVVRYDHELGSESLVLLQKLLRHPKLLEAHHDVYFDQGLFSSRTKGQLLANTKDGLENQRLHFEQNSKLIAGIQLADLAAHACSTMLLEALGCIAKTVKAGDGSGYDPNLQMKLGFELWAGIRHNFLSEAPPDPKEWNEGELQPLANVEKFGFHVASTAGEKLRNAATKRFGTMYLGCIH